MRRYSRITVKRKPVAGYTAIPASASGGGNTVLARAQALIPSAGFDTVLGSDFDNDAIYKSVIVGSGVTPVSVTDKGGVVIPQSGTTANSAGIILPHGAPSYIDNARTSPWYYYARFKLPLAIDANGGAHVGMCAISAGSVSDPLLTIGGGFGSVSTTNFAYRLTNGAGTVVASGTGPAIDTNWHAAEATNDGTTLAIYFDGVSIGTTPATNLGAVPMTYFGSAFNGATAAARAIDLDKVWFVCSSN